jgi:hypothetical protein
MLEIKDIEVSGTTSSKKTYAVSYRAGKKKICREVTKTLDTKKIISELKRRLTRIHQIPIPDRYEMHLVAVNLGLVYENLASVIEAYQDYLNAKENKDFHFKFYQQIKEIALQTIRFPLELIEQLPLKILDEIKSIAKELDVLENAINSELDNIDLDNYFSKLYSNLENDLIDDTYLN